MQIIENNDEVKNSTETDQQQVEKDTINTDCMIYEIPDSNEPTITVNNDMTTEDTYTPANDINAFDSMVTNQKPMSSVDINIRKVPDSILLFPVGTIKELSEAGEHINKMDVKEVTDGVQVDQISNLIVNINPSLRNNGPEVFDELANSDEWVNHFQKDNKKMYIRQLSHTRQVGKIELKDVSAAIASKLGISSNIVIPLIHSGFTVTMASVDNTSILALFSSINVLDDPLSVSTVATHGSNDHVLIHKQMVDFVDRMKISVSVDYDEETQTFYEMIDNRDIPIIALYLADAIRYKGADVHFACKNALPTDDKKTCDNIVTAKVQPRDLLWVNNTRISKIFNITLDKPQPKAVTIRDLQTHKEALDADIMKSYTVNDEVSGEPFFTINFKPATLSDTISSHLQWKDDVEEIVKEIFVKETNTTSSSQFYTDTFKQTVLMRYKQHIQSIVFADGDYVETDQTILNTVKQLSNFSYYRNEIKKAVEMYLRNNTAYVIGTPKYICSKCRQEIQSDELTRVKEILPVDPFKVFFELAVTTAKEAK